MGEKLIFQACLALTISCLVQGCFLDRSGLAPNVSEDSGIWDASLDDAATDSGQDSGSDAGPDGEIADAGDSGVEPEDAGTDSGSGVDSGTDAGSDAGTDSGTDAGTDAGPPRILTLQFRKPDRPEVPVRSFWAREGVAGSWRSVGCIGGITDSGSGVWSCDYNAPYTLPSRQPIRWYASFTTDGTSSSCASGGCPTSFGSHLVYLDGAMVPSGDVGVEPPTAPHPPAGMISTIIYVTP